MSIEQLVATVSPPILWPLKKPLRFDTLLSKKGKEKVPYCWDVVIGGLHKQMTVQPLSLAAAPINAIRLSLAACQVTVTMRSLKKKVSKTTTHRLNMSSCMFHPEQAAAGTVVFVGVLCLDLHKNYTTESESDTTGRYISTYRVQFRPRPVPFNHRIMNRSCDFCPWLSASRCRNTEPGPQHGTNRA